MVHYRYLNTCTSFRPPFLRVLQPKGTLSGGKDKASILSILHFNWIGPLVKIACNQPLQAEHLYPLPPESSSSALLARFEEAWEEQFAKPKGQRK